MFDIGWIEILFICIVALLVIGPQELPHILRKVGRFMAQIREITQNLKHNIDVMGDNPSQTSNYQEAVPDLFDDSTIDKQDDH